MTAEWDVCIATCRECGKQMQQSSLGCHLIDVHNIYQQAVVAEELLEEQDGETYVMLANWAGKFLCSYPRCKGGLNSG